MNSSEEKKVETSQSDIKPIKNILLLVSLIAVLICGIWIGAWFVSGNNYEPLIEITKQPVADVFSSINALFAGLAFGGVIVTVYLQISEIRESRIELKKTADANAKLSKRADEKFILDLFQTYCSEYFQKVKDDSQKVLFSCVGDIRYFEFAVSRLFAANPKDLPYTKDEDIPANIKDIMRVKNYEELVEKEQRYRYKFDEIINFFTLLTGDEETQKIIVKCDFDYSFWRPYFWIVAYEQDKRYKNDDEIKFYCIKPTFLDVVKQLDSSYGFKSFDSEKEMWTHVINHPKISPFIDKSFHKKIEL